MMHLMRATVAQPRTQRFPVQERRAQPVLGIDPGLQRTGYAVVAGSVDLAGCTVIEAGVIRLNRSAPVEQRLAELERSLDGLIDAHAPGVLVCEQLYAHYKHPRTAILMAHARGVILALAGRRALAVINVAATQVKKHLTGSGRAGKAQMQRAIAATLRLPTAPEPHDVSDALAVALYGWHTHAAEARRALAARGGRR